MNIEYLKNHHELKNIFSLNEEKYKCYTPLTDCVAGFSVQRQYPDNIAYSPPRKPDGSPDSVALIHVIYEIRKISDNSTKVPIALRITTFDRYLSGRFDYNFEDKDNCPTKESVIKSKETPRPIALEEIDNYYYDHEHNRIVDKKDKVFSGEEIVDILFQQHCDTIHPFKGLKIQWLLRSQNKLANFLKLFRDFNQWLLRVFTGRTLDPEDSMRGLFSAYKIQDLKLTKGDYLEIFGYKASKNVIVTFCILRLLSHLAYFTLNFDIKFLKSIEENSISSVSAAIIYIWILDFVLPRLFFNLINWSIDARFKVMYAKFKV